MFLVKTISLFSNIRKPTRQPMLWAALAYASGIVCGVYEWRPESWWVVAAIAFVLAAIYFARRRWWLGFPLALGGLVFVVAITHGHSDHIGGIHAVLNNFRPHELWVGALPDTPAIHELLEYAGDLGVRVMKRSEGEPFDFGGVQVAVLSPPTNWHTVSQPKNNDSLVMRISFPRIECAPGRGCGVASRTAHGHRKT